MSDAKRLSAPGLRTYANIANRLWHLSAEDARAVLGGPDDATYQAWIDAASGGNELQLPEETLWRLSAVLGIHRALEPFADSHSWIRSPHNDLNGRSPLDVMKGSTEALMDLRRLVDGWRVGDATTP